MAGQVSKANARQSKANESFYKSYRASSRREISKMKRMIKSVYSRRDQQIVVGANYGVITVQRYNKDDKVWQAFRSDVSKAWARCADKTGVAKAKEIANAYGVYQ
jgi:hypothetical protein